MFLLKLFSRTPLFALYFLSDFLFVIVYYGIRYRREIVMKNLRNSFPEKTEAELKEISKQSYRNLCDYGVESIKLLTISKSELKKRFQFDDYQIILDYAKNNQSIIYLAAHQFNWEWGMVSASATFPLNTDYVYQKISSNFFNNFMLECRGRFGAYGIDRKKVAREVISRRHILRGIATVSDQYPGRAKDKKFIHTFLNQETAFYYGTKQLAQLTQYPVFFFNIVRVKRGYYKATFVQVGTPPYDKDDNTILEKYITALEKNIRVYPSGYLWTHDRWKTRHVKPA